MYHYPAFDSVVFITGQDYIGTVFERLSSRKGIHGLSPENHNLTKGKCFKTFKVGTYPDQKLAFITYTPVFININYGVHGPSLSYGYRNIL